MKSHSLTGVFLEVIRKKRRPLYDNTRSAAQNREWWGEGCAVRKPRTIAMYHYNKRSSGAKGYIIPQKISRKFFSLLCPGRLRRYASVPAQ